MTERSLLNIDPFETGRFKNEYKITNAGNEEHWTTFSMFSENEDCLLANKNETMTRKRGEKVLLGTVYKATDSEHKPVFVSEYKRMLARKVNHTEYKENPNRAMKDCGTDILEVIYYLLDKYPLKREHIFWLELQENEEGDVPANIFDRRDFHPADWDQNVAPTIPLLVIYVVDKVNPVQDKGFMHKFSNVSYETRKRLFVEGMQTVHELLHYQLFATLITAFPDEPYIFDETVCSFLLELFESDSITDSLDLEAKREQLPPEMFMICNRLEHRRLSLKENSIRFVIEEARCPYNASKIECFTKLSFLGRSTFGDVHLAEHKTSKVKYAIKVIRNYNQSATETEKLLETLLLLVQLDNKYLMKYYDAWTSDEHYNWIVDSTEYDMDYQTNSKVSFISGVTFTTAKECLNEISSRSANHTNWNTNHRYTFVVLEACPFSLADKMKQSPLTESECVKYLKQLLSGIQYLNIIGFMHRDIKPQNALINKAGNLLISDLDTLKRIKVSSTEETLPRTVVQTPAYVSPEMLTKIYNERTDYFSAGVTFVQMMYPGEISNMQKFLGLMHSEQSPQTMHPQYAFVIRWLTERDQKDRIGFLSFTALLSLLKKYQYKRWIVRERGCYYILVEHSRFDENMKCIRVANRNSTIREVIKRYTRRQHSSLMIKKIRLRIEPRLAFENHYNLKFNDVSQKSIDLQDNCLKLVNVQDDYVYICYHFEEYEEESTAPADFNSWVQRMFSTVLRTCTTWGSYSFSTINRNIISCNRTHHNILMISSALGSGLSFRNHSDGGQRQLHLIFNLRGNEHMGNSHFRSNHFIIEPSLLDTQSPEDVPSVITLFWAPEKFNHAEPMTETAAIYSFGLFLLWKLLRNLNTSEDEIVNIIMELKRGDRPVIFPDDIQPHLTQLIHLLCAHDPPMRPNLHHLSHRFIEITRPCIDDALLPFRLCFLAKKPVWETEESADINDNGNSNKKYYLTRVLNEYIYTVSNSNGTVEKFFNKLKICGSFKILPRFLASDELHNSKIKAKCMLDFDENGLLVAVPRSADAVDWLVIEHGDSYPEIVYTMATQEYEFVHIHSTFVAALEKLAKYHEKGLNHGNINPSTFLLNKNGYFCISNPILIEADNQYCDRKLYHTEYSAAEQWSTGIASTCSDMYSLGVTLYSWLCYHYDISINNVTDMFRKKKRTDHSDKIRPEFIHLIYDMTDIDPTRRIDCKTALERFLSISEPLLAEIPLKRLVMNNVDKDDDQLEIAK